MCHVIAGPRHELFYPVNIDPAKSEVVELAGVKIVRVQAGALEPYIIGGRYSPDDDGVIELPLAVQPMVFQLPIRPACVDEARDLTQVTALLERSFTAGMHVMPVEETYRAEITRSAADSAYVPRDRDCWRVRFWPAVLEDEGTVMVPAAFRCADVVFYDGRHVSVRRFRIMGAAESAQVFKILA